MAIVAPEVLPQPIPQVREQPTASLETFGGGQGLEAIGQQTQKLSADAGEIAGFEKLRADQTAVQDASDKLSRATTQLLYDPQTGVMASRGTNAMAAHDQGWEQYRKTANDIAGTLHGQNQVGAFNKMALAMGDSFNRQAMAHVSQQIQEHDTSTFNSLISNLTDQGALAYGDPMHRQLLLGTLDDNAMQYARRNGLSADETEALKSKINSNFHEQTLARMLGDKQDQMAQKYFAENRDDMNTETQDKAQKLLQEGTYRGQSARQADDIWGKSDGNLKDAYTLADKIDDAELRDRVTQRLKQKDEQVKEARTSDQDNAFYEGQQLLGHAQQQGRVKGEESLKDIVPPATWIRMNPSQQEALKRLYLGGDENSAQTWTSWSLLSPTDKAGMSNSDFTTNILSHLDKSHRDQALKQFNDAKGNKTVALSDSQQSKLILESIQSAGIIPGVTPGKPLNKLRGDAASGVSAFLDSTQQAVADYERTELGGRVKASQEQTQQIIDKQILKAVSDKGPAFTTRVARAINLEATPDVRYRQIPDDAKEGILAIARHLGKPITQEEVERAYPAYQRRDAKSINEIFK